MALSQVFCINSVNNHYISQKSPEVFCKGKCRLFMTALTYSRHLYWVFFGHITISKTIDLKYLNLYLHKTHCSILETKSKAFPYVK